MNYDCIQKTEVGSVTLATEQVFRQLYETASWYTDVKVEPGVYPVFRYVWRGRVTFGVEMPGVVVGSLFVNRILDCASVEKDERIGDAFEWREQIEEYCFHESAEWFGGLVRLHRSA